SGRPRKQPPDEQRRAVLLAARQIFATHGRHRRTVGQRAHDPGVPRQRAYRQYRHRTPPVTPDDSPLQTRVVECAVATAHHHSEPGRAGTALATMYLAMTESLVKLPWQGDPPDRDALVELLTEFTIGGVLRLHEHPEIIARLH